MVSRWRTCPSCWTDTSYQPRQFQGVELVMPSPAVQAGGAHTGGRVARLQHAACARPF